ncbi:MAG: hypothetical protein ABIQ95_00505 [Bdellovibrionia bacterium]
MVKRSIVLLMAVNFLSGCVLSANIEGAERLSGVPSSLLPEEDMMVIGQTDFNTANENNGITSKSSLAYPELLSSDGTHLIVTDGDCRILIFGGNEISGTPVVVGQSSLSKSDCSSPWGADITAKSHGYGGQTVSDGTHLIVADPDNNRILIYNQIPTSHGAAADVVIGQSDFTSGQCNRELSAPTAATLCYPYGVVLIGGKLVISDWSNNRLLIYNSIPTSNGASADLVIGQANFTSLAANRGGVASGMSMNSPWALSTDGTKLALADYSNNRVMIWNVLPTALDVTADVILGQPDDLTITPGTTSGKMMYPSHAIFVSNSLYVADNGNHRVLYYATTPTLTGASATAAMGQTDLSTGLRNRGGLTGANSLSNPTGLVVANNSLYVSDSSNNRILKFSPIPTSEVAASEVFGQANFSSYSPRAAAPSNKGFTQLAGLAVSDKYLIVPDQGQARALIFDKENPREGALAVLGKPDFAATCVPACPATSASSFAPISVAVDKDQRLYVADPGASRILVFNQIPTTSGAAADYVIGQDDFITTTGNSGTNTAGKLAAPQGVWAYDDKLFVADTYNHRVLVFQLPITQNRPLAILAIGAPDVNTLTGGSSQSLMSYPSAVFTDGSKLLVTEWIGNRVKVYNTIPTQSGALADYVLGAPDFNTIGPSSVATANNFGTYIVSSAIIDNFIFTADKNRGRILGFDMSNITNGMDATRVLGQTNYTDSKYYPYGSADGKSLGYLNSPVGIVPDPGGKYIWIADRWAYRVIRIKRSAFWKYVNK